MKRVIYKLNNNDDIAAFKEMCASLGIKSKPFKASDIDVPIGSLFGISLKPGIGQPLSKAPEGYRLPEILVCFGFKDDELDELLSEYHNRGLSADAFKAVTTMYNMYWTPYMLVVELTKERNATF